MKNFFKILGPGLLFASTAIGVSHLVQSTRAGMEYGFGFLIAIIVINICKYPFFEFGTRYAAATGTTLIDGYKKLGKWALYSYLIVLIVSLFFVSAAVFQVTAVFLNYMFHFTEIWNFTLFPLMIVVISSAALLIVGKFKWLDIFIKAVGLILVFCTLAAFILVLIKGPVAGMPEWNPKSMWQLKTLPFAIALMGWMPTAVDLSTWNSIWTLEKIKVSGFKPTVKEAVNEFALGYWISAVLAVCFLTLGAYLVYGTNVALETGSAGFANQVISLFTQAIGDWSFWIIAIAAFAIMYGTSVGVLDGYSRALLKTCQVLKPSNSYFNSSNGYIIAVLITACGGSLINVVFSKDVNSFLKLIDVATTLSFLFAPIVAWLNFKLVTNSDFPTQFKPKKLLYSITIFGLIVLSLISVIFILNEFGVL